jgi:hypothetical protein
MDTGIRTLAEQDINTLSTTKQTQYGAVGVTSDGRRYRYVGFSGTSTVNPGMLVVAAAVTANYQGLTITAAGTGGQVAANLALGSTQIVLTNGSSAITQDQFAEGYLEVLVGAAGVTSSYSLRIKGNSAAAATTGYVTVYLAEPLRNTTALIAGTDTANLNVNVYSSVGVSATADIPVGVTVMPVPNTATVTNYGWVLVNGPCDMKNDAGGTVNVGTAIGQSVSVAGSFRQATASTSPVIGYTHVNISASTSGPVFLNIS